MGRKPNQFAHCNQPIATPRKRRHVGYDGWLKGHAPLIIAMHKEGKGADTILGVLASKKDVILHYGGNPKWKMAARNDLLYFGSPRVCISWGSCQSHHTQVCRCRRPTDRKLR